MSRVLVVLAVGAIDFTFQQAITPALPAIQLQLDASATAVTWLVTGFLLATVVSLPLAGPLGDRYGRRRVLLWSLAAFTVGSVLCAVADDMPLLITGRVVQGLGGGLVPLALAIAGDNLPAAEVPRAIGFLIGASGIGVVVGALLTGFLVDEVSVAAVFWGLCGISVLTAVAVRLLIPESPIHSRDPVDWAGALLLGTGLGALMLAISQGNEWGWASASILGLLAASVVLVGGFAAHERGVAHPLIPVRLLSRRPLWTANAAGLAIGLAYFIPFPLVALIAGYPESTGYGLGMTSTEVALLLTPGATGALVGGIAGGRLVTVIGARRQAILGGVFAVTCYAALLVLPATAAALAGALIPMGAAIGVGVGAIISLTLRGSSTSEAAVAAGVNTVVRTVGSALGPQVAAAVVVTAPALASGLPAEDGFDRAFAVGLLAAFGALACAWIVPTGRQDPLLARD